MKGPALMNSISQRTLLVSMRPSPEIVEFHAWLCEQMDKARRIPMGNKVAA